MYPWWTPGILSILEKSKIDYSNLIISETKTGKRINIDLSGKRDSYIFPGANRHLSPQNVEFRFLKSSRMIHICPENNDMVVSLPKNAGDTMVSCHIDRSCPMAALDENIDFVFIDSYDAIRISGQDNLVGAGMIIKAQGPENVILTDRGKGVTVFRENEHYPITAPVDKAYDASDYDESFLSGFIYRYLKTSNLKSSLSFGLAFQFLSHSGGKKLLFQDVDLIEDKMYTIMRSNNE